MPEWGCDCYWCGMLRKTQQILRMKAWLMGTCGDSCLYLGSKTFFSQGLLLYLEKENSLLSHSMGKNDARLILHRPTKPPNIQSDHTELCAPQKALSPEKSLSSETLFSQTFFLIKKYQSISQCQSANGSDTVFVWNMLRAKSAYKESCTLHIKDKELCSVS